MMYEELTFMLTEMGVPGNKLPTVDEYHDAIEPVYNYHPAFSGTFGKAKCAEIYKAGGLGVFFVMREEADDAKDLEETMRMLREKRDAAQREYDAACDHYTAYREAMMNLWRCE